MTMQKEGRASSSAGVKKPLSSQNGYQWSSMAAGS
jgi:hypothetical protein